MDWKNHWDKFPANFLETEFLQQVGKTVQGQPISLEQFEILVETLIQYLDLNSNDIVLDLCCGNGLITSSIAKKCQSVVGIDFSEPLVKIAKKYHQCTNSSYYHLSVLDIDTEKIKIPKPFTKIYMYEALQHLKEDELIKLLNILLDISAKDVIILFTSVPDKAKLRHFYNTPERLQEYELRKSQGTEAIGTWWDKSVVSSICSKYNLLCEYLPQPEISHTSHYRFDVRVKRK